MRTRAVASLYSICLILSVSALSCASSKAPNRGPLTATVWTLDDLSTPDFSRPYLGEILADHVIDTLQRRGGYTVVERERLISVLTELNLSTSSLADEENRLRLGKLVGARCMVFGGYQIIGDTMRIDLRLVDVQTSKILNAVHETMQGGNEQSWIEAARRAAEAL